MKRSELKKIIQECVLEEAKTKKLTPAEEKEVYDSLKRAQRSIKNFLSDVNIRKAPKTKAFINKHIEGLGSGQAKMVQKFSDNIGKEIMNVISISNALEIILYKIDKG